MDCQVALDTARLLAPKAPLALLRTLESSHRPHLAPEEVHRHRQSSPLGPGRTLRLIQSASARVSWASLSATLPLRPEGRTFHRLRSASPRASEASLPAWPPLPRLARLVDRTLHLQPSGRPVAFGVGRNGPLLRTASQKASVVDSRVVVLVEDRFRRSLPCPQARGLLVVGRNHTVRRATRALPWEAVGGVEVVDCHLVPECLQACL